MIGNYHTHCRYCDGFGEPEDFVKSAIKSGLTSYGFSSHAPLGNYSSSLMSHKSLHDYVNEISRLKKKYRSRIQIFLGLEIDYIPGVMGPDSDIFKKFELDYTIGAVHYVDFLKNGLPMGIDKSTSDFVNNIGEVYSGNVQSACKRYFKLIRKMVQEQPPTIVAHLDKMCKHNIDNCFFSEDADWYNDEVDKTLDVIHDSNSVIEFNTRGLYIGEQFRPYPSLKILKKIKTMEIPLMINTDAHRPDEVVKGYKDALKIINEIGFTSLAHIEKGGVVKITDNGSAMTCSSGTNESNSPLS